MATPPEGAPRRPRLATIWLGGCSGCHMSLLDLDERLFDLAAAADLVYSPLLDIKQFPDEVDVTLVEGAVANDEQLRFVKRVRAATRCLVSLGDCAGQGNVTAMRNPLGGAEPVLKSSYGHWQPAAPLPVLLDRVWPVHQVVAVDVFLPGCPPSATLICEATLDLLAGRMPDLTGRYHFG